MRILSTNMCSECCYCIDDYDNNGFCCKDLYNKPIKLNQSACEFFCDDTIDNNLNYTTDNDVLFDEEDDFYKD